MRTAFESVFGVLRLSGDRELVALAERMSRVDYDHLASSIKGARDTSGSDYSPNLTTFSVLIPMCDQQADSMVTEPQSAQLVHDEQIEFEKLFSYWFSAWKNSAPFAFGTELRMPLRNLSTIEFRRSDDEIGIRVADILASAVRVTVQDLVARSTRTTDFFSALRELCCSRDQWAQFPHVIGGQDFQLRVWNHLAPMDHWR